ncbi:MAG: LysM peptidoglycan-binding domain-containing protein [Candidatus Omnitrophica bacterium]|nr:LysM peptidoglycan-binding domain-containing protein [Candidatus Omnitrophota bacterium]
MVRIMGLLAIALVSVSALTGCTVRTYPLTRDRIDQDLTAGNRGFVQGTPSLEEKERKTTRQTRVFEIELGRPLKLQACADGSAACADASSASGMQQSSSAMLEDSSAGEVSAVRYEQYTVAKGDTLQKISNKFFGTTKKWQKIYNANQDILKGPDKLYPGQVINIPVDGSDSSVRGLK